MLPFPVFAQLNGDKWIQDGIDNQNNNKLLTLCPLNTYIDTSASNCYANWLLNLKVYILKNQKVDTLEINSIYSKFININKRFKF